MGSNQEKRHALRHRAIIEAATEVFAERGIHAATLVEIGEKVGLSKASLYYYVKNKEQIIADVLESVLADIDQRTAELTDPESRPLQQLKMRARAHIEGGSSDSGRFIVMNLDHLAKEKNTAAMMREHEEPARQLLQQAIDAGEIREIDVTAAVKLLYGGLNNVPRWHKPEYGTLNDAIEATWDIFVGGLLPR